MKPMITLNMCDFCSLERSDCGAQPVLADLLNLKNLESEHKKSVVACDAYISPVDVLKERFHDPDL
ncbi:MAG: hypothetical protein HOJ79_11410 [Nitrospina sp.]|nr:hypothetical protein [Nitrospina sp.]